VVSIVKGVTGDWELVIGLEVHAQMTSNSKLFSGAPTTFGADPNTQVSFVDAGFPGMLPILNEKCVEQAVKTGLGLNAKINLISMFDRKNYFYPDLPNGYQISQFYHPIVGEGVIYVDMPDGTVKAVGVERLHIEQDAGKSMHDQSPTESFLDFNRAGVGLMEIVSKPDIRSSEEAGEYLKKLRAIVRYLETCDGDMEKGSLRCDANVSVRRVGDPKFGTRVEIKNVNSIKNVMRAIDHEAERQVSIIEAGGVILQETRLFDATTCETRSMRSKEEAHDYRYFQDPDLLPLKISQEYVDAIAAKLPELPDQKIKRYKSEYGLSHYDASVLVSEKDIASYYEQIAATTDPKMAANWVTGELFAYLNRIGKDIEHSPISAHQLAELVGLIQDNTISGKIAKQVFEIMTETSASPKDIVEKHGLKQVTDTGAIEAVINQVLTENPDKVTEYKSGKDKLFGFFVGQVMKLSQGKANPQLINEILKSKLDS
jgi:aspartyl-tRNA(Asn)/glutamyl-tRNA(Gln) amidotransferase subunit B